MDADDPIDRLPTIRHPAPGCCLFREVHFRAHPESPPTLKEALHTPSHLLRHIAHPLCALSPEGNNATRHTFHAHAKLLGQSRGHGAGEGLLELEMRITEIPFNPKRDLDFPFPGFQHVQDALPRQTQERNRDARRRLELKICEGGLPQRVDLSLANLKIEVHIEATTIDLGLLNREEIGGEKDKI